MDRDPVTCGLERSSSFRIKADSNEEDSDEEVVVKEEVRLPVFNLYTDPSLSAPTSRGVAY